MKQQNTTEQNNFNNNDNQIFINSLKDIIIKNKNGFTIDFNLKPMNYKKGFYVGLTNNFNKNVDIAINNLLNLKNQFKQYEKNLLIGLWFDTDIKTYFLDLSIFVENKKSALLIAKLFNQKAIFNIKDFDCINVKY
jgi:hypothetical protein